MTAEKVDIAKALETGWLSVKPEDPKLQRVKDAAAWVAAMLQAPVAAACSAFKAKELEGAATLTGIWVSFAYGNSVEQRAVNFFRAALEYSGSASEKAVSKYITAGYTQAATSNPGTLSTGLLKVTVIELLQEMREGTVSNTANPDTLLAIGRFIYESGTRDTLNIIRKLGELLQAPKEGSKFAISESSFDLMIEAWVDSIHPNSKEEYYLTPKQFAKQAAEKLKAFLFAENIAKEKRRQEYLKLKREFEGE